MSRADKERLLRIAKRPRKRPFNAIMDPTEFGAGSTPIDVSYAVQHSGSHDLWDAPAVEGIVLDVLETVQTIKVMYSCPCQNCSAIVLPMKRKAKPKEYEGHA
ncbi:hypothetical protein OG21DRAFT_1524171 [Imleria badia]|nr:hypothetical protein OG21DRAFT_1524171 [Imleria badia]